MAEREDEALFDQLFRCIGNKTMNNDRFNMGKSVLIIFQYSLSVILLVCSIIIYLSRVSKLRYLYATRFRLC